MEGRTVNSAPDSKGKPLKAGAEKKKKTQKQRLIERLTKAGVKDADKMTEKQLRIELQRIKSQGGKVPDLRHENQGQPVSLSKNPKITEMKMSHLMEEVDVTLIDKKTGEATTTRKATMVAMLDMLRHEAMKNRNVPAAKEYFDRTLGKAKQEIELETIDPDEQRLPTKADIAAAKAYLAASREDDEDY